MQSEAATDDEALAKRLAALAYPSRVRILRYLVRPSYLEEIASHLSMSRQAALKHVRQLEEAGFIAKRPNERDGVPVMEYTIVPGAVFLLTGQLEHMASLASQPASHHPTAQVGRDARTVGIPLEVSDHVLVAVRGPVAGRRFALPRRSGDALVVGRGPKCDIPIMQDPFLSLRHAELRRDGARLMLNDLRSTNATAVNGMVLPPETPRPVVHGDIISLGVTLLVVWDAGARA